MGTWGRNPHVIRMREEFSCCPGCGRTGEEIMAQRPHPEMNRSQCLTVEHIRPRSQGGTNDHRNLMIICHRCNFTRGNQSPWNWYGEQHLIYSQGWPVPQQFYGKRGEENRRLWRNRARMIAALLGQGPVEFEGEFPPAGWQESEGSE